MSGAVSQERWSLARTALRTGSTRLRGLLLSGADPQQPVTAHWSAADTAAHLLSLAIWYAALFNDSAARTVPLDVPVSPLRAALRRDVVVGGPRPWLLPAFLRVVHMPDNAVPT